MKRFQQALQEDGTYNSVAFSYQYDAPTVPPQYPQTAHEYESLQNGKKAVVCNIGECPCN